MREIKFRAWHKRLKRMFEVYEINWEHGIVKCKDKEKNTTHTFGMIDLVLLQYTGLKDSKRTEEYREGQEIYEGYIIEFEDTGEEGYEYKEGYDFTNRATVVFEKGRFELENFADNNSGTLDEMNNCPDDFYNMFEHYAVVIGNIYENPELVD